jgi:type I restriction enzyme R subunit
MTPEARARQTIDALLTQAGWHVCDVANANIHAGSGAVKGVAIREFPLNPGHGFADYLLYVNGKACGVIEAKKAGATLSGVEVQSARYAQGLPAALPAWRRPLPFVFESTGVETRFTNGLDPAPRARALFAFFRPELLLQWLIYLPDQAGSASAAGEPDQAPTFIARLQHMPKALIQMAIGIGKAFTAISFISRLIKFGGARRVLFLVDRGNRRLSILRGVEAEIDTSVQRAHVLRQSILVRSFQQR